MLASALIHEFPEYYRWYSQKEFTWNGITQQNRNGLLWRDPTVDGVKTGHTDDRGLLPDHLGEARRHAPRLASCSARIRCARARTPAPRCSTTASTSSRRKRVYAAGQPLTTVRVWKGERARGRARVAARSLRDEPARSHGARQGRVRHSRAALSRRSRAASRSARRASSSTARPSRRTISTPSRTSRQAASSGAASDTREALVPLTMAEPYPTC